jgi:predicted glycogen debranching enzyme
MKRAMSDMQRSLTWPGRQDPNFLLTREWLVTNGLGGYASGTIAGVATRRFHGLLIAALPAPLGRTMMFNRLIEQLRMPDGTTIGLCGDECAPNMPYTAIENYLSEFRLENGLPVWCYEVQKIRLQKLVIMPHRQNTVHIKYKLLSGTEPVKLELSPAIHFRPHEGRVSDPLPGPFALSIVEDRYEIRGPEAYPPLRLKLVGEGASLTLNRGIVTDQHYRLEANRGYDSQGTLWSPGYFMATLKPGQEIALIASTEPWTTIDAVTAEECLPAEHERRARLLAAAVKPAQSGFAGELVLAADQFITLPAGRFEETARARAAGDEARTVIAGYHWFNDWGRDTMISLEGLTLATGRYAEAGWILRTFAQYVRDGLIPNSFPEGEVEGQYHTADASLWFFHALDRYIQATGDHETSLSLERNTVWHRCRREGWIAEPRCRRLPADLDGCQGRRLGCHAASR